MKTSSSSKSNQQHAWAILGTGMIARSLAKALESSSTSRLLAVGSRNAASAEKFGKEFGVSRCYGSYEEVLADPEVSIVYISLPNHMHAEWSIRCAQAGKHILCEKPLASNHAEAMTILEAARHHEVYLMEAFMYRCHPQTAKILEIIRSKVLGEVRVIQSHFSFNFGDQPENIRSKRSMSGGGIMDVGCYAMSLSRLIAGAALGMDGPAEPIEVKGTAHIQPPGDVDTWAAAVLKFPGDILANLSCGMQVSVSAPTTVWGSKGHLAIPNPWFAGRTAEAAKLEIWLDGKPKPKIVSAPGKEDLYTIEVDTVVRDLKRGQSSSPVMSWNDSLGNIKALDAWRKSIGLVFACEQAEGLALPASKQPLRRRAQANIPTGKIPGLAKPVSRVILGTMSHVLGDLAKTCAMLDHFVENGGNTLDTAWAYGTENLVGQWIKLRDIRKEIVLIGKGAAENDCTPALVTSNLLQSLERLQTEHMDVFLMHRDNPQVPVGEFVDVLNQHKQAGRFHAFGGSNWSVPRLREANTYAKKHGLSPFTASSPNLTLASWNEPMWKGCASARDPASRSWYSETDMPLLAWSSQASGFFTGKFSKADQNNLAAKEIVRVWFNDGNFERLARVREIARKKKVSTIQIALAWVLCQKLNIFALIGPETIEEMRTSLQALDVRLTLEDLAWLDLEVAAKTSPRRKTALAVE